MTRVDRHHYDMLVRVKQFGLDHADLFPADSVGGRTWAALATAVDRVGVSLTSDDQGRSASRFGTLSKAAARAALRRGLDAVTRTARGLAADTPGLEGKFRVLSAGINDLELATVGRAFILDAASIAEQFIAHGLPPTFVADLQAALDAFEGAARNRVKAREAGASARAVITAAVRVADEALARLDAIVPNLVLQEPALLAAWRLARHVRHSGGSSNGQAPVQNEPAMPVSPVPPQVVSGGPIVPPPIPQA